MISSIKLTNFQAHQDTTINFHKGINAIIGISTSGKSSVIRALNWIYSNKPSGNSIISYWNRDKKGNPDGETSAAIEINGKLLKRIKTSARKGYDVDDEELGAIGQSVPEKVLNAMNLSDISFQSQHSPHFLLSQSSGEVSTFLNTVLNLSVIDETLTKVNEQARAAKKKEDILDTEIESITKSLKDLDYLPELVDAVRSLNANTNEQKDVKTEKERLRSLIESITMYQDRINKDTIYLKSVKKLIDEANVLIDKQKQVSVKKLMLQDLCDKINSMVSLTDKQSKYINDLKPLISKIDPLVQLQKDQSAKITKLKSICTGIKTTRELCATIDDALVELKAKMPETCPMCGGKL